MPGTLRASSIALLPNTGSEFTCRLLSDVDALAVVSSSGSSETTVTSSTTAPTSSVTGTSTRLFTVGTMPVCVNFLKPSIWMDDPVGAGHEVGHLEKSPFVGHRLPATFVSSFVTTTTIPASTPPA